MQKELYDRFSGKFYMLCRRYTGDDSTAQEVLCDGFLSIFEQIINYRGEGSFEGWMRTIIVRCAIKRFKREQRRREVCTDEEMEMPVAEGSYDVRMEMRQALMLSMRRLSDMERHAFNLVAVEGYKLEEAAELTEEKLSTFKSRYYKALQKMRMMMKRFMEDS